MLRLYDLHVTIIIGSTLIRRKIIHRIEDTITNNSTGQDFTYPSKMRMREENGRIWGGKTERSRSKSKS